jgi:16S rRNA (guanine966-N2)-methyltransferase
MDRVKEAVFNILGGSLFEARFLDLFAGTGSVGIEALSRGAEQATFVEREDRAVRVIGENLKTTGLAEQARVVRRDVFKFIAAETDGRYDFIYVAPPQYQELWAKALQALDEHDAILAEDGQIIVQIFPKEYRELDLAHFEPQDERKYGSTLVVFYGRKQADAVEAGDAGALAS